MASYIHAGILFSTQANPPEIPPYIQIFPMGNLNLQLFQYLQYHCFFLFNQTLMILSVFPSSPITRTAQGE